MYPERKTYGQMAEEFIINQSMTPCEQENFTECLIERAAIMEMCGNLSPEDAKSEANVICLAEWQRGRKAQQ